MERINVSQITVDQRFLASVGLRMLVRTGSPSPLVGGTQGLHWPAGIAHSARFHLAWHLPASADTDHRAWKGTYIITYLDNGCIHTQPLARVTGAVWELCLIHHISLR